MSAVEINLQDQDQHRHRIHHHRRKKHSRKKSQPIKPTDVSIDLPPHQTQNLSMIINKTKPSLLPLIIVPTILKANFCYLYEDIMTMMLKGANWLHFDVMDGHFVNNLTIGPPVIRSLTSQLAIDHPDWSITWDGHMMVDEPEKWVDPMKKAGLNSFTFQLETCQDPKALVQQISTAGMKVGIALSPYPPKSCPKIEEVLEEELQTGLIHHLLILTTDPDDQEQIMIPAMLFRIRHFRVLYPHLNIMVEGGIHLENMKSLSWAGCNMFVSDPQLYLSKNDHLLQKFRVNYQNVIK